jgi:hypothetical protein
VDVSESATRAAPFPEAAAAAAGTSVGEQVRVCRAGRMAEQERQEQSKCLNMFAGRRGRQKQVGTVSGVGDGAAVSVGVRGGGQCEHVASSTSQVASRKSQGVLVGSG